MNHVVSERGWSLRLIDGWTHKHEEYEELLTPPDGGPGITIFTSKIDGGMTESDLRYFSRDHSEDGHAPEQVKLGDFHGLAFRYVEDDIYYRHWYVACGNTWLQINYDCKVFHQGHHDSAIDRILRSLVADVAAI